MFLIDLKFNKCVIKPLINVFFVFDSVLDQYKTQEMSDRVFSENTFLILYCCDRYKTQRMCDEAADDFLLALKFIPDWFFTSKVIKKIFKALCANENIFYFNEYSGDAIFSCNAMVILSIDVNDINDDDSNYDEDDPETIIHVRLLTRQS